MKSRSLAIFFPDVALLACQETKKCGAFSDTTIAYESSIETEKYRFPKRTTFFLKTFVKTASKTFASLDHHYLRIVDISLMEFLKAVKTSRFLDPANGFQEIERLSEVRYDPLTAHTSRILDFPFKEMEQVNLASLIERSKPICPFCPEIIEQVVPKFHPDLLTKERYCRGEAICFPNAFPYDENGAVTVMTQKHYMSLTDFNAQVMYDSLLCCLEYLIDIRIRQPEAIYQSINWNYMPLAGGSIIHPHLQVNASTSSTNYYTDRMGHLLNYENRYGISFWDDLIESEAQNGERFIARTNSMTWLVAFAPLGVFDVMGIFNTVQDPCDLDMETTEDLVNGILNVLSYINSLNMYSLNMSIYFLINNGHFMPHVRICPRVSIPPLGTSQINYMRMLHNEPMTTIKPEDVCKGIKSLWY